MRVIRSHSGIREAGAIFTACALLLCAGTLHGRWAGRWGENLELTELARRVENLPSRLGEWQGERLEMDGRALEIAEAAGGNSLRFTNQKSGDSVVCTLICGRPGPISVHPPTACFRGAGYTLVGSPQCWSSTELVGNNEFLCGVFRDEGAVVPESTRVLWGWSAQGEWSAPNNPRLKFAGEPALVKLYVAGEDMTQESKDQFTAVERFVNDALPQISGHLFAGRGDRGTRGPKAK